MTQEHKIVTQEQAEAMDDMGAHIDNDYVDPQELEHALAVGRLQAGAL